MTYLTVPPEGLDVTMGSVSASRPPEPPTRPITGPLHELKSGKFYCRVPGCTKPDKEFSGKHAVAIHISRRHGLTMEGKPSKSASGTRPPPAADPAPDWRSISVRDVLSRDNVSLVFQTIRILEQSRDGLTGKLNEMEGLKRKSAKLDMIIGHLKELLPGPGPAAAPVKP